MKYIFILSINRKIEFIFDNLSDALNFISNSMKAETEYNNYSLHQEEVDS